MLSLERRTDGTPAEALGIVFALPAKRTLRVGSLDVGPHFGYRIRNRSLQLHRAKSSLLINPADVGPSQTTGRAEGGQQGQDP